MICTDILFSLQLLQIDSPIQIVFSQLPYLQCNILSSSSRTSRSRGAVIPLHTVSWETASEALCLVLVSPIQERHCHTGTSHQGEGLQPVIHQERTGLIQLGEVWCLTVHNYLLRGCMEDRVRLVLDRMRGKRPRLEQGKFQVNAGKSTPKEHARLWSSGWERRWHLCSWRCSEFNYASPEQLGPAWLYSDH